METIVLRPLVEGDLPELEEWHQDHELRRRYGGTGHPRKLYQLTISDSNRKCWIAEEHGTPVGYVDFERQPSGEAWIGLVVKTDLRGRGYGQRVLRSFLMLSDLASVSEVCAGIEQDNVASIRCFRAVGFRQMNEKPDHDGCLNFSFPLS